jgi:hypothetical protein
VLGCIQPRRPICGQKRARARAGGFAEKPSGFSLTGNGFFHYFSQSLTTHKKTLQFLILRKGRSPTTAHAVELRRAVRTGRLG